MLVQKWSSFKYEQTKQTKNGAFMKKITQEKVYCSGAFFWAITQEHIPHYINAAGVK